MPVFYNNLLKLSIFIVLLHTTTQEEDLDLKNSKIWGPGLEPHSIVMPARYFFIEAKNSHNKRLISFPASKLNVSITGVAKAERPCRVWTNVLDRKDGSFIVRYKVYERCKDFKISVKYKDSHVALSPYEIQQFVQPDDCNCPLKDSDTFLTTWKCGKTDPQIIKDLGLFDSINWDSIREPLIKKFDQPHAVSLCHYVLKDNLVYRKCYGKYVGFNMFMDSILLSLTRKVRMQDLEFFVNLGDWPLVKDGIQLFPIFSWCGSTESRDIVMPTYDITESTLENMGRVMLDMLSVQGNVKDSWENRIPKAFWRGRDANQHRLDLVDISRAHPDLFNVSLTNFFFFRDKQEEYGPKTPHISFFNFFDYKYQLSVDGTVAAYRFPYLLAGGSLVFKQDSNYYEHFYNKLVPNTHYVPIKRDLSDLVEKLNWALQHDDEAKKIAQNGQIFANHNLLPLEIICYYSQLLHEFGKLIKSKVRVLPDMELVEQQPTKNNNNCECNNNVRDEL